MGSEMCIRDRILLDDSELLTSNDCKFRHSLYLSAIPGQKSLDFKRVKETEIHRCGLILKLLDGEDGSVKCIV